ncbi:hypothetical protein PoB_005754000 [Plakobranchus ocellatus]|uniref:Uncharacterized protein n=1 Tax=Plakobranchus ocellatus TaxID=259542 RepID=A0AAV4CHL5_9GAST|nr:hypothetical protein PoB_005754000 [Plakobranchus ocellatus]
MSDRTSRSRCPSISDNAMATVRTDVRNLLLYVSDVARVVMSNVIVRRPALCQLQKRTCSQQQDLSEVLGRTSHSSLQS